MLGKPSTFWGKLLQDSKGMIIEWHPLLHHCADVAAVAEAILSLRLWRIRLARLAGQEDLDEITCARLCVLCALHDLGKFALCFQKKGRPDLPGRIIASGHVTAGVAAIFDARIQGLLGACASFGEAITNLMLTALAHHGRPHCPNDVDRQKSHWTSIAGLDPLQGVSDLVAACRAWFPKAFAQAESLPESAHFEHAFAGLLTMADWIASDPEFYPFSSDLDWSDRINFARAQATKILSKLYLDIPLGLRKDREARPLFFRISEHQPSAVQRRLLDLPEMPLGSITVLESETGSGKTEAALAHFMRLFEEQLVDGLYFALPTRTAATQIHQRVYEAAKRAFGDDAPPVLLAVPGYLRVDEADGEKILASFDVLWPDHYRDRLRFRGWAAENSKRYFAGAIIVGTIDQVLLSTLRVAHAHLRNTALLRHLLVVDEVHASDAYMTRILQEVLARQFRAGGHSLLLSATLAGETRQRLLTAGENGNGADRFSSRDVEDARQTPYPLITHRAAGQQLQTYSINHDGRSRTIKFSLKPWLEEVDAAAAHALDAARKGAKVLILRNTVTDCVATQMAVETLASGENQLLFQCHHVCSPHHSRYAKEDRQALDEALQDCLGKNSTSAGLVVVATQTVQQSLDIDVDLLITDLCPMDVLLQRVGRLHRHARSRPPGFADPEAVILVPAQRDLSQLLLDNGLSKNHHGLGSVYENLCIIEATWRQLELKESRKIPEDNRVLVEDALHSQALSRIAQELGPKFKMHEQALQGALYGNRRLAQLNLIDWTRPYSEQCWDDEASETIQTRLGEGDRRAQFDTPILPSPFGQTIRELTLPAMWARGAAADAKVEFVRFSRRTIRFEYGERKYIYDRFGLRPESALQSMTNEEVADDHGP